MALRDPWDEFDDAVPHTQTAAAPHDAYAEFDDAPASAPSPPSTRSLGSPTGQVHDGDTFRLSSGANARLYGVDAFELDQTGRSSTGAVVPLGRHARSALVSYAVPSGVVTPTGASTYGRPVANLTTNGDDAASAILNQGLGIATPQYLRNDPARLNAYMEAERAARLNRRGAWAGRFEQPASYRHGTPDPWAGAEWSDTPAPGKEAVFFDDPTPFQGLRPEIAKGYSAIFQDRTSKPEDLIAYAKANGFQIDPADTRRRYAARDKGATASGAISYKQAPRVLTNPGDGTFGAALRGVADPFNVLDETGALADTLFPGKGRENVWSSDRRFGDIYANNLDQNRSVLAYDDANHPYARFGGQLVGGLIAPGASIEGVGFTAARDVLEAGGSRFAAEQAARNAVVRRLAVTGAGEGAAAGVGQGEDWQSRVQGGLIGAPLGGTLGVGTGLLAPKLAALIGRPFSRLAGRDGEAAAQDFTDGALDAAKAATQNDASAVPGVAPAAASRPASQTIDTAALHAASSDASGAVDMGKAGDVLRSAADDALARGDTVTLHVEGKAIPITRPGMVDEQGQRWGAMSILSPKPGDNARLEIGSGSAEIRRENAGAVGETGAASGADPWAEFGDADGELHQPSSPEMRDQHATEAVQRAMDGLRQPDRIDVSARPRPLLGDVTDAERAAMAERIQPGDLLPLPNNTVDGVEETARIEAGRYAPVPAGDERDVLTRRNIPSATTGTPIAKRGPLDLVAWLRSQGGIKAQGRELEHYGIDNAPRKGMDFAGGENRLGPLVSNDGMTYDDAAHEAWEAGFFPDHPERPDVGEFLDALNATHSGRNRAFRPDDLAEVDAFNAARDNRYAVESAKDQGAPLTEDRAGPVGMGDLDANAPPVDAYHEWGEKAPNLAGNIRLDKLDSPQAIKRALAHVDNVSGGFDAARRGRITQAETKSLAADLGMTPEQLLARNKGAGVQCGGSACRPPATRQVGQ